MSSAADSRARTSVSPDAAPDSTVSSPGSGLSSRDSFASYDPATSSWRMSQLSLLEDSVEWSATWPRAGWIVNGTAFQLPPSAPLIEGTGSGSLPTPTTQDAHNDGGPSQMRRNDLPLNAVVKMWPTPTAKRSGPDYARMSREGSGGDDLETAVARQTPGQLNPEFVEWMLGFPIGWTDILPR